MKTQGTLKNIKPPRTRSNPMGFAKDFPHKDISGKIISCAIEVHSTLGPGLLESVYEEALSYEFELRDVLYERQKEISLNYKHRHVGKHRIDFLVEDRVIVELKAVELIHPIYEA